MGSADGETDPLSLVFAVESIPEGKTTSSSATGIQLAAALLLARAPEVIGYFFKF